MANQQVKWLNILMTADAKGAVCGQWSMVFEAGKTYRVDSELADKLMALDAAALTGAADWVLHVPDTQTDRLGTPPFWGSPID